VVHVVPKWTQASPREQIHPHKAHKKLRFGQAKVGRHTVSSNWLRESKEKYMTKLRGKPPYRFLHRKNVLFPKKKGVKASKGSKHGRPRKARAGKASVMSRAASKAWKTRRKRGH
jgi:hypothetical protein